MSRLRKLFVLVAAGLLVPMGLLGERAVTSVEAERDAHHTLVAERIFDEMERELSTLLQREEERPFGHYRFNFVADALDNAEALDGLPLNRSPLSEVPSAPYVVGWFELDPQGRFSTPLQPTRRKRDQRDTSVTLRVERLRELVARRWPTATADRLNQKNKRGKKTQQQRFSGLATQLPGTTVALNESAEVVEEIGSLAAEGEQQQKAEGKSSLQSFNRGVSKRSKRGVRTSSTSASNVLDYRSDGKEEESGSIGNLFGFERRRVAQAESKSLSKADAGRVAGDDYAARIDLGLEPMVGTLLGGEHLILYRTVWLDGRALRQGVVLDIQPLANWLYDTTVGDSSLAGLARVSISSNPSLPDDGDYRFSHRFAEPFANLGAALTLAPLPDAVSPAYVYALVALLLTVGIVGLLALYRMVAVVVTYAQRRSDFVSAVTHELKTPLTSIRMYGEMLAEEMVPNDEKRHEYYRHITAETERLSRLINNVLELARLEKGRRDMTLVAASPKEVIEEVLEILSPQAASQGFTLRLEVDPDLPPVRFDRDALLQVLFNLVDNAVKYGRKSEKKEILISCRRHDQSVILAVRDHGPGVTPRHLKKIFEPFYRGQNELTRTAKGTGIGLALVKGLVERMNGQVKGRNPDGGGFEVTVALPAAS